MPLSDAHCVLGWAEAYALGRGIHAVSHVGGRSPVPELSLVPPEVCVGRRLESRGRARNAAQAL